MSRCLQKIDAAALFCRKEERLLYCIDVDLQNLVVARRSTPNSKREVHFKGICVAGGWL